MNKKFVAIPSFIMYVTHKCVYIIEHPRKYYRYSLLMRFLFRFSRYYSDKKYLLKIFPLFTGYKLDLDNPKTFNEKLQWLKLYYHKPEFSSLVDKAEAKNYAARIIGEEHIIPTLAIYNKVDEIDFDSLPEQFVLKCTHDSGDLVIYKSTIDQEKALKKLSKGLKFNYYHMGKEWVYKNVKPRVIAEKYLSNDGEELKDYKIFNFGGEPKIIEVDYNRFKDHKRQIYTPEWEIMDVTMEYPSDHTIIEKPKQLDQMLDFARKLSKGHPFIRTDFYVVDDIVYFGELTPDFVDFCQLKFCILIIN